jgi:hypothetical protein
VEIPPGTSWADFLAEKLSHSKAAIVLWSKTSVASQWVREEARLARDRGKLIPVMIDDAAPPFGFGEIQAANLAAWDGEANHPHWKLLLEGIARAVAAAPREPASSTGPSSAVRGMPHAPASAPALGQSRKLRLPLMIGGAVVATAVVLVIIASMIWRDKGSGNVAPVAGGDASSGSSVSMAARDREHEINITPPRKPSGVTLSPSIQAIVEEALASQTAARAAAEEATAGVAQANRALQQSKAGTPGFGTVSWDNDSTATGDLNALRQGRPGAVTLRNSKTKQTVMGLLQLDTSTGAFRSFTGAFDNGRGGSSIGKAQFSGQSQQGVGRDTNSTYTAEGRSQGIMGTFESQGIGVVMFADGHKYEGRYIQRGQDQVLLRHGLGVTYDVKGVVQEAGRYDNDKYLGP